MKQLIIALGFLGLIFVLPAQAQDEECEMLFVEQAKSMAFSAGVMTLMEVNPTIIFFCDRPVRIAGHMTLDAFMRLVSEGENSFKENPPNAALSIFGKDGDVALVVMVLPKAPKIDGTTMSFEIQVLEGTMPKIGGPIALFIDPIGRPISPTSRAGVHRRHQRRAVRD
jgi:hypothetical protein